jgi:hypothetical protein
MPSQSPSASTAASLAAEPQVVTFNNRKYPSMRAARNAYNIVGGKSKAGSMWSLVRLMSTNPENHDLPFQLRCKNCGQSCQLNNPAKWKKEHKCPQKEPVGVPEAFAGVIRGVLPQNYFLLLGRPCKISNEIIIVTNV